MNIIPDFITNLFERQAKVLGWVWIPDNHIVDEKSDEVALEADFVNGDDYVVLRLAEMYLKTTRVLWRESYPLVHSFVVYGDPAAPRSIGAIAGPGQLKELGTDNLDRLIGLAYRLAGPFVYDGQDIELLAGLYAVPAKDGAKVLIDTLAQLSGLVPALKQATDVAGIVKGGMEGLLGIAGTKLTLGIRDALRAPGKGVGRAARPGFLVALNAPADSVAQDQLWIKGGRLYEGPNPLAARLFDSHDMMLFELHRGPSRSATWATLPALSPHATAFDAIFKGGAATAELKTMLNKAFVVFETDLRAIDDLTRPDKAAIRASVADDLKDRMAKIDGGGLFETRSVGGQRKEIEVRGFSPLMLPDAPAGSPLPSRAEGLPVF
ncbi:hypothetical protein GR210_12385 [Rhizobium leguminosarum]|uniref:hypothetical protein n=1 Tax=Rhizobium leguminosarum TaxID=384 RepID=UPI0013D9C96D|nr:hypothetical protein [Rhizobium leguminosarum]NEH49580.1 hypothetical protein [Rhizobium leguminosarum]